MLNVPTNNFDKSNLNDIIRKMIDSFVQNHKLSKSAHEEIMAMAHLDEDVAFYFHKREMEMTEKRFMNFWLIMVLRVKI